MILDCPFLSHPTRQPLVGCTHFGPFLLLNAASESWLSTLAITGLELSPRYALILRTASRSAAIFHRSLPESLT